MTPRWSRMHTLLAAAVVVAAGLSVTAVTPASADGYRGHGRVEHHEWRGHEYHPHRAWGYARPYHYGYAYPGYYYAPAPVYAPPPSVTVVVPFR